MTKIQTYMEEQGNALMRDIMDGHNPIFNATKDKFDTPKKCLQQIVMDDYAGWLGMRQLEAVSDAQ